MDDEIKRVRELADAWQMQKTLSDENQQLSSYYDKATPHQLIRMWDSGLNLHGKKLSSFELAALIEQWIKVFGSLPPDDDDLDAMDAAEASQDQSVPPPADDTMLDMKTVVRLTGVSKSTIKRMVVDGQFPKPIALSPRRKGWIAGEVKAWLNAVSEKRSKTRH